MIIDIIALCILLISAIVSFLRGFIREILTIIGVVGGIIAAFLFGSTLEPSIYSMMIPENFEEGDKLFDMIPYDIASTIASYGILFIIVVVILSIISHYLSQSASEYGLGAIDRTLGVIFGIARAILIIGLLYLPIHIFSDDEDRKEWFKDSQSIAYIEMTSNYISSYIPGFDKKEEAKENITKEALKKIDMLKDETKEKIKKEAKEEVKEEIEGYKEETREKMDNLFQKQNLNE